jgi:hypothetical protein
MTDLAATPIKDKSDYFVESVISKDGTKIGYRKYGAGPGIILVQGAIGTTQSYHDLAANLASDFTAYVPERRGRPLSPREFSTDHTIEREIEDLEALFERSDAHFLFGLSSGAVIAIEAARVIPAVHKAVIFEAPLYVPPEQIRLDLVSRFHREVEAGTIAPAMISAVLASGLAPPFLSYIPRIVTEPAVSIYLRRDAASKTRKYPPIREIIPTMRYDFNVVSSMQNKFETFRSVECDVLLLSSSKSPEYLRKSAVALEEVLPSAQQVELKGLDHSAPWNTNLGGGPDAVAKAMREFFTS